MEKIQMFVFDIDGVITDGKRYIGGGRPEVKSISMKDLDAVKLLRDAGYKVGCISGEDNEFSRTFAQMVSLDYVKLGCKEKEEALRDIEEIFGITPEAICYIGDGKYDIRILQAVGLALCPADAIEEVKRVSHIILKRNGGDGCIAESYTLLTERYARYKEGNELDQLIQQRVQEHTAVLEEISKTGRYTSQIRTAAQMIIESYQKRRGLFLCGNGGSAADAQHLAAELVGRFYLERQALSAEALTVNTSVLTSLANDYDYNMIFARQLEARAVSGDVLIGITTSGTSENILQAFQKAKEIGAATILMTGKIGKDAPILQYTDCLIDIPSQNTPRIQEMHILIGHTICEIVEKAMADNKK